MHCQKAYSAAAAVTGRYHHGRWAAVKLCWALFQCPAWHLLPQYLGASQTLSGLYATSSALPAAANNESSYWKQLEGEASTAQSSLVHVGDFHTHPSSAFQGRAGKFQTCLMIQDPSPADGYLHWCPLVTLPWPSSVCEMGIPPQKNTQRWLLCSLWRFAEVSFSLADVLQLPVTQEGACNNSLPYSLMKQIFTKSYKCLHLAVCDHRKCLYAIFEDRASEALQQDKGIILAKGGGSHWVSTREAYWLLK